MSADLTATLSDSLEHEACAAESAPPPPPPYYYEDNGRAAELAESWISGNCTAVAEECETAGAALTAAVVLHLASGNYGKPLEATYLADLLTRRSE